MTVFCICSTQKPKEQTESALFYALCIDPPRLVQTEWIKQPSGLGVHLALDRITMTRVITVNISAERRMADIAIRGLPRIL